MTSILKVHCNNSTNGYLEVFKKVAPSTGSNTIVVTTTAAPQGLTAGSIAFANADQSAGVGSAFSGFGNSAAPSAAVTSNVSGNVIASFVANGGANTTGGTPTKRVGNNGASNQAAGFFDAGTIAATGSSVTTSWTLPAADWWAVISVEILTFGGTAAAILPQQSKHRMPAVFTRIASRRHSAVYSR